VRLEVAVTRLPHGADLPLPGYESPGAAGLDLIAANPEGSPLVLDRFARAVVPTGIALQIPSGYEAQIRPRSGLALSHGVTVLNAPGTIDADYRGEVKVLLINFGATPFVVMRGMRVAQLVFAPVARASLGETERLDETGRGAGGFGSTGL
jgi:dUTP pyrophosphatase